MKHNLPHSDDLLWFRPTRQKLLLEWKQTWDDQAGTIEPFKCTTLFGDTVDLNNGHISIACSVADEYQQITDLLHSDGLDLNPILFLRLYLYLLDEFTSRIKEASRLIAKTNPNQPPKISIWANRYAKHKASLFILHHAMHVFADGHQGIYQRLEEVDGEIDGMCLRTGVLSESLYVLNEAWFKKNEPQNIVLSNKEVVPTIAIPPLMEFLHEATSYFIDFVNVAKKHPEQLQKFQSQYHWPITPEMEYKLICGE